MLIRIYKKSEKEFITRITKIKNKKPQWEETLTFNNFKTGKKALEFSIYKVKELKSKNEEYKEMLNKLMKTV